MRPLAKVDPPTMTTSPKLAATNVTNLSATTAATPTNSSKQLKEPVPLFLEECSRDEKGREPFCRKMVYTGENFILIINIFPPLNVILQNFQSYKTSITVWCGSADTNHLPRTVTWRTTTFTWRWCASAGRMDATGRKGQSLARSRS